MIMNYNESGIILTAGSSYLDIDAYACMVAMAELLRLKDVKAIAYSKAPCNYSVCQSLVKGGQIARELPPDFNANDARYIIVDVSDPDFLKTSVPLDHVVEVYDHHAGFEDYWQSRIGDGTHIEFLGAAATLIYREWKKAGLQDQMSRPTALLLIAAILDNTLNLTSSNTTDEDMDVFSELCQREKIGSDWCTSYFSQVQANVEADLKNALLNDIKTIHNNSVLPPKIAQLCVWNAERILLRLSEIREWFGGFAQGWMINIIDIAHQHSIFLCDTAYCQTKIEQVFDVVFHEGVAKTKIPYLRKEIIKKTIENNNDGG